MSTSIANHERFLGCNLPAFYSGSHEAKVDRPDISRRMGRLCDLKYKIYE
jgi:hypothetical protein